MKAIVTGHTKGLGAAIAGELLARGVPVLGLARGGAAELAAKYPALLREAALDLSDAAALGAWLAGPALREWLDGCGTALLVNNAGVVNPVGPLAEQDPAAVVRAVSLNVAAPLALAAAVVRAAQGAETRILHISSGAARNAYPGWSVYCATKAALDHHARAVALDGDGRVRAVSLAPGVIDTGMQAEIRATPESRFPMRERFVQMKNQGALAAPEQSARKVVAYLLAANFGAKPVDDVREV
ncbi:SDR family oxidoreductase [Massilia terrae]|uniref:SDR family oxidoreductase n=1 Tax=Massilia terrae TaxID=1811224 RepID=A0ABT2D3Z3_9BURK|nr:SDR family oxidoreductase [Massilia terrae]MCS0660745.1 SDR family oxidoreductase [Massilia terrae]